MANAVAVSGDLVVVAGRTAPSCGLDEFRVRSYGLAEGTLLWEDASRGEGIYVSEALDIASGHNTVFAAGATPTADREAFTVGAYSTK